MDEREDPWGSYIHRPTRIMLTLLRQFQECHGQAIGVICMSMAYDPLTHVLHCLCPIGFWMPADPLAILCGASDN